MQIRSIFLALLIVSGASGLLGFGLLGFVTAQPAPSIPAEFVDAERTRLQELLRQQPDARPGPKQFPNLIASQGYGAFHSLVRETRADITREIRQTDLKREYDELVQGIALLIATPDRGELDFTDYPTLLDERGQAGLLDLADSIFSMLGGKPAPLESEDLETDLPPPPNLQRRSARSEAAQHSAKPPAPAQHTASLNPTASAGGPQTAILGPTPPSIPSSASTATGAANATPPQAPPLQTPNNPNHRLLIASLIDDLRQEGSDHSKPPTSSRETTAAPKTNAEPLPNGSNGSSVSSVSSEEPRPRTDTDPHTPMDPMHRLHNALNRHPSGIVIERDFPELLATRGREQFQKLTADMRKGIIPPPASGAPSPLTDSNFRPRQKQVPTAKLGKLGNPGKADIQTTYWQERVLLSTRVRDGHPPIDPADFPVLLRMEGLRGFSVLCQSDATELRAPPSPADQAAYWHDRDRLASFIRDLPKHRPASMDYPALIACDGQQGYQHWIDRIQSDTR